MQRQRGRHHPLQLLGVAYLIAQLANFGFDRIPPVTLAAIAGQVALFVGLLRPPWDSYDVCISVDKVVRRRDFRRLFFNSVEHADDWHLYYNMVSLLWKGSRLERRLGSRRFAVILLVFSIACSAIYLILAQLASEIFDDYSYCKQCAIGFSGVLFGLKVVAQHLEGSSADRVFGVSGTWSVLLELVLIQMLAPRSSLLGHLAGVATGVLYVYGPLRWLTDLISVAIGIEPGDDRSTRSSGSTRFFFRSSTADHSSSYRQPRSSPPSYGWNIPEPSAPPSEDRWRPGVVDEDEDFQTALRESRRTYQEELERRHHQPSAPSAWS